MANKISFWKIFGFLGFLGEWATESLKPEPDGKVLITVEELGKLAKGICAVFGWDAVIELPEEAAPPKV